MTSRAPGTQALKFAKSRISPSQKLTAESSDLKYSRCARSKSVQDLIHLEMVVRKLEKDLRQLERDESEEGKTLGLIDQLVRCVRFSDRLGPHK